MPANSQKKVLLFGGTSEAVELAEWLAHNTAAQIWVSSATGYGAELLPPTPSIRALVGRLDASAMQSLVLEQGFSCIVDATHPYAVVVSQNVRTVANAGNVPYLRVVREDEPQGAWTRAADIEEAARIISDPASGRVLLTTGTKDLPTFARLVPDFTERVYARILPVADSLAIALDAGLPPDHIVAMKGPFSRDFNAALIRELRIDTLVTKASGTRGGFWEKVAAAESCGCGVVVVGRPSVESEGLDLERAKTAILNLL